MGPDAPQGLAPPCGRTHRHAFFGDEAVLDGAGAVWDLALLDQHRVAALRAGPGGIAAGVFDPDGDLDPGFGEGGVVELSGQHILNTGGIGQGPGGRVLVSTRSDSQDYQVRAFLTDFADLAPAITDVSPYVTSLSVEWAAPEGTSEHPVRIWHLVALDGAGELAGQTVVAGDVRQASLEGLDPLHESYEVVVLPYDDFGPTIASPPFEVAPVASAPAAGPAPAVTGLGVAAGKGFATVSWAPPAHDGGSTIWGYSVVAVRHSDGSLVGWRNVRADVRRAALPGLTNGVAHDVYVFAVTSLGFGAVGTPVSVTPSASGTAPATPQMDWVSVVPAGPNAVVTWGPPLERGEVAAAVHVIVLEDGQMTQWKAMSGFDRQVVVPASPSAQIYLVAQSAGGFGPLSGPFTSGG